MKKSFLVFSMLLGIYAGREFTVSANSDYEVKIPDVSILNSEGFDFYSQQIRELNQEEIDKLPMEEQQDAISKVLEVIAEINKEEISLITKMKEESLSVDTLASIPEDTMGVNPTWINYGDILITLKPKHYGWNHGHAGIAHFYKNQVIESNPGIGTNVHTNYVTYWINTVHADELYVGGASQTKYKQAVGYANTHAIKNTPYKIASLSDNSTMYCSKLVYKAWLAAGYNVGDHYKDTNWNTQFLGVTPKQILWDDNVFLYKSH